MAAYSPVHTASAPYPSRRALLAGALGGIAALAATAIGGVARQRADAAVGDNLKAGSTVGAAGTSSGVTNNSDTNPTWVVTNNGKGIAVRGSAPAGTGGRFTTNSRSKWAVSATNTATQGGSGSAIRGDGVNQHGVQGFSANANRYGVIGTNTAVTGDGVAGVAGTGGTGVIGFSTGGYGMYGTSNNVGVYGYTTSGTGVKGEGTTGMGVYGVSVDEIGVYGHSTNNNGIYGSSTNSVAGGFSGPVFITKYLDMTEMSVPPDPVANTVRIFVRDNVGATELCVKIGSTVYVLAP